MGTRVRGGRHPVEYIASELGVDRKGLVRRLEAAHTDSTDGITFREAFEAWQAKAEREEDRARRQKAEADTAEITAADKRRELMLRSDTQLVWDDGIIEIRRVIQSREQWKSSDLLVALSKVKLAEPNAD